jgi:very-short-patch-repair endonuclease
MYGTSKSIATTKPVLREAPPVLELEEHEKFRDEDRNVYEVEVRGVREEDKIYFRGRDIEKLFEMDRLVDNVKQENTLYIAVQDYEQFLLVQQKPMKRTFFTSNGIKKFLTTSRSINPSRIKAFLKNSLIKHLNINVDIVYLFKEQEILSSIEEAFKDEDWVKQYSVKGYRIDLYFTEYNLAIECDEHNHKGRNKLYEEKRERKIKDSLQCTFIRFNPDDPDFRVSKLIKTITVFICDHNMNSVLQEKDARIDELNREIGIYQERETEWTKREVEWSNERKDWTKREAEWTNERKEWTKRETEWTKRETEWTNERKELLKIIKKL